MRVATLPLIVVAACLALAGGALAQQPAAATVPLAPCFRARIPIVVDGVLSESDWSLAPASRLSSWDGQSRQDPPTSVRTCWDDTYLYVAFSCQDPDCSGMVAPFDSPIYEGETVEVFLDPLGQGTSHMEFGANAAGSAFDARYTTGPIVSADPGPRLWNAPGFLAASRVEGTVNSNRSDQDAGWSCEMAIPFSALSETGGRLPRIGDCWRVNFCRFDIAPEGSYFLTWSPTLTPTPDFHVPSRFGYLRFEGTPAIPQRSQPVRPPGSMPPLSTPTGAPVSVSVLIIAIVAAGTIAVLVALRDHVNRIR